jgi:histidinol-phosphate aminotransferase
MVTNRRHWLKHVSLALSGIGLANFKILGNPTSHEFIENLDNDNPTILLRSNENPYGPSPLAKKAFTDNFNKSNRYNWDITSQLISELSKKNNVNTGNILLGAGSTEILDLVAKYASLEKGNYVIADPSYDYWTVTLDNLGLTKIKVPATAEKKIDLKAMLNAINIDTKLVYICNPNNPTGTICERESLVKFISEVPPKTIILVDEAYLDFTQQQSLTSLINNYPNLIITKTFSKLYGLAGARIGYALANKETINKLSNLSSAPNDSVSVLSRIAAMASLKDESFIEKCFSLNEATRKYTINELKKLDLEIIPSNTNFIYFSLINYKNDYFQRLKDNNIQGTRIYEEQGKWTRITVGTMQEMQKFILAIK